MAIPFLYLDLDHVPLMLGAIAVGTAGGVLGAQKVQMTQMPQMVALFNGVGGGAAALVALLELHELVPLDAVGDEVNWFVLAATAFTIAVGSVSFAGSIVTFAKLQELMTSRPVVFPGLPAVFALSLVATLGLSVTTVTNPAVTIGVILALVGLVVGVLLVMPVGGADVPIVISLLNAFTGLSVAAGGYVLENVVLLVRRNPRRGLGDVPHDADGQGHGPLGRQHPLFGALRGGSTRARRATGRCGPPGCRTWRSCWGTPTA